MFIITYDFCLLHKSDIAKKTTKTTKEHLDDIVKYLKKYS